MKEGAQPWALRRSVVKIAFVLGLGWLCFLWPTFVNRGPFLLADTTAYMRGADAVNRFLTGKTTQWTDGKVEAIGRAAPASSKQLASDHDRSFGTSSSSIKPEPPVILAGRSVYYGAILYAVSVMGGFSAMAALQAALAVACITMVFYRFARSGGYSFSVLHLAISIFALAVMTPVAYFASYMVPDLYVGLGATAMAFLIVFRGQLARAEVVFWWSILLAALVFHSANLLILGATLIALLVVAIWRRAFGTFPFLLLLLAFLLAIFSEILFSSAVRNVTGTPPIRPPFVAARLIEDGAGRTYLRERCGPSAILLCRWRDQLPSGSDSILWGRQPGSKSFASATPTEQRQLASEQSAFIIAVIRDRPLDVARGSLNSFGRQLSHWSLSEFNYNPADQEYFAAKLPPPTLAGIQQTAAWHECMPVRAVEWSSILMFTLSLLALATSCLMTLPSTLAAGRSVMLILTLAILFNAGVTGMLSTPHDRYQMRIVWILPMILLALLHPALLILRRRLHSGRVTAVSDDHLAPAESISAA